MTDGRPRFDDRGLPDGSVLVCGVPGPVVPALVVLSPAVLGRGRAGADGTGADGIGARTRTGTVAAGTVPAGAVPAGTAGSIPAAAGTWAISIPGPCASAGSCSTQPGRIRLAMVSFDPSGWTRPEFSS